MLQSPGEFARGRERADGGDYGADLGGSEGGDNPFRSVGNQQRDPVAVEEVKHETLSGKIVGLRQAPRGEYIFTLDNQQVWMQAEVKPNIVFAVGETVHIEHGMMSSLWLAADKGRKVRVTRMQ